MNNAKNNYFKHKLEEFRNDMKNTWKVINSLLKNKNDKKYPETMYDDKGMKIQGNSQIADAFNEYLLNAIKEPGSGVGGNTNADTLNESTFNPSGS